MNLAIKSRNYARVLLDVAEQENALDLVFAQVYSFVAVIRQVSALKALLTSMRVTADQKRQLLEGLFKKQFHPVLLSFVLELAERRDLKLLPVIARRVEVLYRKRNNSVKVVATSSVELTETQVKTLTEQVVKAFGKEPDLDQVIDPNVIGGLRLRVGNTVIDGSLASRLGQLKKNLIQS
ncbi:MAG: ATP synthase F1 subunit delta [Lentisphaeria bacterium]|nr:ATP synthase F1 subunit delta [Candidatus Neomarinimicrobiota bacterium]MCF7842434.1 ATP synthase F1 subunit delta [Lentisphaeria bacterium]